MTTTTLRSPAAPRGDVHIWGRRRLNADLWALLALVVASLIALSASYVRADTFRLGVEGRYAGPYLLSFHDPEAVAGATEPSYRWTRDISTLTLPGLGRGTWETQLRLSSPQPADTPKQALVTSGDQQWALPLQNGERTYHILVNSPGDLDLRIEAAAAQYGADPRPLGVVFFGAEFVPVAVSFAPPVTALLAIMATLILMFTTLRIGGLRPALAITVPLMGLLLLAWGSAAYRAPVGVLVPKLVILAVVGLVAVVVARWAWAGMVRLGDLQPEPWLLPALILIFYVGFWIKATGLLFPYSHAIDVPWHMRHTRDILNGQLARLYQPGAFSESVMPTKEWGANRPVIPYSPFFHIFATVFAIFPWRLETSANVFSVLVDTSRTFLIALLALRFGLRSRTALLASLLYALTPFTFLLHSWGNIPTTFGMWWTLLATTVIALGYHKLHRPKVFALLTAVLLCTMLIYTVMAVFMGVFIVGLLVLLLLFGRGIARRSPLMLGGAFALAVGISLVIYYGQYIPPMIERTLPYFTRTVVGGEQGEGQDVIEPFGKYASNYIVSIGYQRAPDMPVWLRWSPLPYLPSTYTSGMALWYGVTLPLFVGLPGIWLLRRNRLALLMMLTWLAVAALFFVAGSRVSMVDKHLFYIIPAMTITCAAVLDAAWQRWRWTGAVIAVLYLGTFLSAIDLWLMRLARVWA
jgi:hypothetical protein